MKLVTLVEYTDISNEDHSEPDQVTLEFENRINWIVQVVDVENHIIAGEEMLHYSNFSNDLFDDSEQQFVFRLTVQDMKEIIESHKENWEELYNE